MAQFAVYRNKNPRTRATFPLLVDVQTELLEELQTRVVIPLTKAAGLARKPLRHLTPAVSFEDTAYVLMTPQLAGIARSELGEPVGSVARQRRDIIAALDFLLTGF
ncbi:MAG: CcdB family protein [Steroidobacterales bacterium]